MNERTYQAIIGVLVVVVLILGWWIIAHPAGAVTDGDTDGSSDMNDGVGMHDTTGSSSETGTGTSSDQTPTTTSGGSEAVSVSSQPAGDSVTVSSVTLAQAGWVAVRDSSGRTLGAAWVDAGTHTNVTVPLLRGTEAGKNYQVLLYVDGGDDHVFDLSQDILITNSDGSVAGTTFSTQ